MVAVGTAAQARSNTFWSISAAPTNNPDLAQSAWLNEGELAATTRFRDR